MTCFQHRAIKGLWIALALFVIIKNLASPAKHTVYPLYSAAARELMAGDVTAATISHQYLPYFYGILGSPFAQLPNRYGGTLWGIASLGFLLLGLRALIRELQPLYPKLVPVLLIVTPIIGMGSIANNQSNMLILGSLAWGTACVLQRRWWSAALLLALPGFKFYPLALGLLLSVLAPRQLSWRLIGAFALWNLLPFAFWDHATLQERFAFVAEYIRSGVHYDNYSFLGVREYAEKIGLHLSHRAYFPIQAGVGAILALLMLGRKTLGHPREELITEAFILTSLWSVTFGPSIEAQTYLLAGPALAILWVRSHPVARMLIGLVVAVGGPMHTDMFSPAVRVWVTQAKLATPCMLAVFAYALVLAWGASRWRIHSPMIFTSTRLGRSPSHSP